MKKAVAVIAAGIMLFGIVFSFAGTREGELLLGYDSLSGLLLPDSVLAAGQRYEFPVFVSSNKTIMPLSDQLMQKYSFKITNLSSKNAVKEFALTKRNGYYYVAVMADEVVDARYSLTLVDRASGMDTLSLMVEFSVSEGENMPQMVSNPPTCAI